MILGVGTDIVEIDRIRRAIENPHFKDRVYTPKEQEYCDSRGKQAAASYAARFSGKEAVAKAFGTGFRGCEFTDIEIIPDELGCPKADLFGRFAELATEKKVTGLRISLSHAKEYATAQCILEGMQ